MKNRILRLASHQNKKLSLYYGFKIYCKRTENITSQTQMLVMLTDMEVMREVLFEFPDILPEDWIIVSLRTPNNSDYEGFSWYDIDFNNAENL